MSLLLSVGTRLGKCFKLLQVAASLSMEPRPAVAVSMEYLLQVRILYIDTKERFNQAVSSI